MEEYALTQEDIERLGITDAMPGEPASYGEMRALGIIPDAAPAEAPVAAPVAVANPAASQSFDFANFDMPQPDFGYLTDPYANLTKTQRRMLAFAAIKDAGMALQGKEGTSYETMMADITTRADMARKAKAAQAQQQMMSTMFAGGVANLTPEQAIQYVAMGILPPEVLAFIQQQREATGEAESELAQQQLGIYAIDQLLSSPNLDAITGFSGTVNEWLNSVGAAPEYARLRSYLDQIGGLNFLEAYQQLKGGGQITEIEGKQATAARTRLDAALKGRPEDLRVALLEVRKLFDEARAKNPAYQGSTADGGDDSWMEYLNDGAE